MKGRWISIAQEIEELNEQKAAIEERLQILTRKPEPEPVLKHPELTKEQMILNCYAINKVQSRSTISRIRWARDLYHHEIGAWKTVDFFEVRVWGEFKWYRVDEALQWHEKAPWGERRHANVFSEEVYVCQCN